MKVKIGDIDLRTYNKICDEYRKNSSSLGCTNSDGKRCPFSKPGLFVCTAVKSEFCEEEVEIPDNFLDMDNREKEEILGTSVAVTGTCWNSQQGPDGFRIHMLENGHLYFDKHF